MATKKKESAKAKEAAKTATSLTSGGLAEDFEKLGVFYLGRPYDMAAIWNPGSAEKAVPPNFCIVTREPNELGGRINNRMPVILREEHLARWLDPSPNVARHRSF